MYVCPKEHNLESRCLTSMSMSSLSDNYMRTLHEISAGVQHENSAGLEPLPRGNARPVGLGLLGLGLEAGLWCITGMHMHHIIEIRLWGAEG